MVEVEGCGLRKALGVMESRSGFRITRHLLQVFGLCPDCREGD
jgi:Fe2+ or Zn2+ uptake regulation protein